MLFVGTEKFITEILEEHMEILGELWRRRPAFLRSPYDSVRRLGFFDERIEAHTDGLVVAGKDAFDLLHAGLNADEPELVTTAVFTLLKTQDERAANQVWTSFENAEGPALDAFREAFLYGPLKLVKKNLEELARTPTSLRSAVALEVLVFQHQIEPSAKQVATLIAHDAPVMRKTGWRIVSLCEIAHPNFETGWNDDDANVRSEALHAAGWRQYLPVLDQCRCKAGSPSADCIDELQLLGVLGEPDDLELILSLGRKQDLGVERFRILGAYGHPQGVEILLEEIGNPNAAIASAAGVAFMTITGRDIESDKRAPLMPEDGSEPDEFEQEFLDDVALPNPEIAIAHWNQVKEQFANGTRWRRGFNVSEETTDQALELLDLESRYACRLRSRFTGAWDGWPQDLERMIPNEPIC